MAIESDDPLWQRLVKADDTASALRAQLFQADDRVAQLREALSDPGGDGVALRLLENLPVDEVSELAPEVFRWTFEPRSAVRARNVLARLDQREFESTLERLAGDAIATSVEPSWTYRRLAELFVHLGQSRLLAALLTDAAVSQDPEVSEIAAEFEER